MRVQTVRFKRAYVQIAEQILQLIRKGELKPGDRLPTEREMAALFQTSRPTVREAMSALELAGIVEVLAGRGVFVRSEISPFALGIPADVESGAAPSDLLELRLALEPAAAAHAALRAQPANIAELEAAVAACAEALAGDRAAFENADDEFHLRIAYASQNPLFAWLAEEISELRSSRMWQLMKRRAAQSDVVQLQHYADEHRAIVAAIKAGDAEAAARWSTRHLERVRTNLLQEGEGMGASSD